MTRYEKGFIEKCAERGVDVNKLPAGANTYNPEALRSLSGLVGNDDVARVFIEDSDDRKKRDFNKYVLHATNPDIDYNSDRFSAQFDQFLNANLREMRKRKLKRILLEAMRSKNGITGAVYPNKDINSKLVSLLNGDDMRYLSSEKPWNGRSGTFIRGSGEPVASV